MFIKIFVTLFVLFAVSRVWLRTRDRSIGLLGSIIWTVLWAGVTLFTWWPKASDILASEIGIGRGVDALFYISVLGLFYAVFRLYVKMEFIEHELTALVRQLALRGKSNSGEKP